MTIDPDLVRAIMRQVEATPANRVVGDIKVPPWTEDEVLEHLVYLFKGHLLDAQILPDGTGARRFAAVYVEGLTPQGHEFLSNTARDTVWERVKAETQKRVVPLTVALLAAIAEREAKRWIGP
jgi:hypothetical protein